MAEVAILGYKIGTLGVGTKILTPLYKSNIPKEMMEMPFVLSVCHILMDFKESFLELKFFSSARSSFSGSTELNTEMAGRPLFMGL